MDRHTFKCLTATGVFFVLFAVPVGIGLAFFVTPCDETETTRPVIVAEVSKIPTDGLPHYYQLLMPRRNAWSPGPPQEAGNLFLLRSPGVPEITALSATHSSLNVPVEFIVSKCRFESHCWRVEFDIEGHCLTAGFDDLEQIPVVVSDGVVSVQGDWIGYVY